LLKKLKKKGTPINKFLNKICIKISESKPKKASKNQKLTKDINFNCWSAISRNDSPRFKFFKIIQGQIAINKYFKTSTKNDCSFSRRSNTCMRTQRYIKHSIIFNVTTFKYSISSYSPDFVPVENLENALK